MNVQPFPSQSNPTAEANGTVVINMLTLEVAVEDINTPGESAGLKTAHATLLEKTGWPLACCFGAAVQKGKFRAVSGTIQGMRHGYQTVTEEGYAGELQAWGSLKCDAPSQELRDFAKFTKQPENREVADIPEEAKSAAVRAAAQKGSDVKLATFVMNPVLQADILVQFSSFTGAMQDPVASKEMLEKASQIQKQHFGDDDNRTIATLEKLALTYRRLHFPGHAKELLERVLKLKEQNYGRDSAEVSETLKLLYECKNPREATEITDLIHPDAMRLCRPELQEATSSMIKNIQQLGQGEIGFQHCLERYLPLQEQALQVKEQLNGEHHFRLVSPLMNLATMYQLLWQVAVDSDQLELANDAQKKMTERFERAKEICHRHFGEEQADLLKVESWTATQTMDLFPRPAHSSKGTLAGSDSAVALTQAGIQAAMGGGIQGTKGMPGMHNDVGSHAARSSEATPTRSDPVISMMQAAVHAQCEQLVNMGFSDRGTNTQALLMAKGDINQAISFLIGCSVGDAA